MTPTGVEHVGASALIHTAAILRLSFDQPIMITLADRAERIERILEPLREMAPSGEMLLGAVYLLGSVLTGGLAAIGGFALGSWV